ncbi:hypothetical protein [Streptomyces sp. TLI_146]|uniref:hypothetical protein n=1 Tax=Streptomyces sp. TLI_146 TaxID=1938858 RepID=UPI000C7031E9|nr:hypothetical protein [Streptomyces sp. TLI_146]PKV83494.1 hypothetical protein BX283_0999 [Streptomyces sp. TLI_146]
MNVIALDGADNSGKTTQLRLLRRATGDEVRIGGSVHHYQPRWPELSGAELAHWWFTGSRSEELVTLLLDGYRRRLDALTDRPGWVVLDRGLATVEASCVASVMLKDDCSARDAEAMVAGVRAEVLGESAPEPYSVLLGLGPAVEGAALSVGRERGADERYARYQYLLHTALQTRRSRHSAVIEADRADIVDVQNQFRSHLSQVGLQVRPLLGGVRRVIGLGGMSESGKSSAGEYLRRRFGTTRLKLGYLIELAAARNGLTDPYGEEPRLLAELVVDELDRYAHAHYYLLDYTIESLHRPDITSELKRLLGKRLDVVYLDASPQVRARRSLVDPAALARNDEVKRARGADRIAATCDLLVDNSGPRPDLEVVLDRLMTGATARPAAESLRVTDPLELAAPTALRHAAATALHGIRTALGERLLLFAVAGSVGFGTADPELSDLDVLLVVESGCTTDLAAELARLRGESDVKLGITVLTRHELLLQRCDSRTYSALYSLGQGRIACQYVGADLELPAFTGTQRHQRTIEYLARTLHEIRRPLLGVETSRYRLYKSVLNAAKMLLRLAGVEETDPAAISAEFERMFPAQGRIRIPDRDEYRESGLDEIAALASSVLHWFEEYLASAPAPTVADLAPLTAV